MAKAKATSIGEYIIEIADNGSVKVYRIPKVAKDALKDCAEKAGVTFTATATTQSLGKKILTNCCDGEASGTIGEYHIERREDNHIDVYQEYCNTKEALREISELIGFDYDNNWDTQHFGRQLVKFAEENGPFKIKKAKKAKDNANNADSNVFDIVDVNDLGFLLEFDLEEWTGDFDADEFAEKVKGDIVAMAQYGYEDEPETIARADDRRDVIDSIVVRMNDRLERNFMFENPEEAYRKLYYANKVLLFDNDGRVTSDEYTQDDEWIARQMFAAKVLEGTAGSFEADRSILSWPYDGASCIARFTWNGKVYYSKMSESGEFEESLDLTDAQWSCLKQYVMYGDEKAYDDLLIKDKWLRRQIHYDLDGEESFDDLTPEQLKEFSDHNILEPLDFYVNSLEGIENIPNLKEICLHGKFLGSEIDLSKCKSLKVLEDHTPYLNTVYVSKGQDIDFSRANVTVVEKD